MTADERARFEVLLEQINSNVKLLAEGYGAHSERFERMEARFDSLEGRFDGLDAKVDVFASDTNRRLTRIERHLRLNGPKPRRKS